MKKAIEPLSAAVLVLALTIGAGVGRKVSSSLSPMEELGKMLFFDENLSTPPGQSCAACHGPEAGMTGPDERINKTGAVYEGALQGRFGNRKPPTAAYAGASPVLHIDEDGNFVGGMFWDGRASGEKMADPLAEQAMGPFLNPLEQNIADGKSVVLKVRESYYADLFEKVWGEGSLDPAGDAGLAFERIARSIAAYERSSEVNPFSSKFDEFWRKAKAAGLDVAAIDESSEKKFAGLGLDPVELRGLVLFNGKAKCSACHVFTSENGKPPVFTDFTYDNLGVPRNPDNPFYKMPEEWNPDGEDWVDEGLGGFLKGSEKYAEHAADNIGKHKVPTLRNVALSPRSGFVKAYMHNGAFKDLLEIVQFYSTRDSNPGKWPPPEVKANLNLDEMGDLKLTPEEEAAVVAFMKTLSDKF
jgi:cytochrome c peroxidase